MNDNFCISRDLSEKNELPPLKLTQESVRSNLCNMMWLEKEDQRCLTRRGYPGVQFNEVILRQV